LWVLPITPTEEAHTTVALELQAIEEDVDWVAAHLSEMGTEYEWRVDILSISSSFLGERIDSQVLGYESDPDFQAEVSNMLYRFALRLGELSFNIPEMAGLDDFVVATAQAFAERESGYEEFSQYVLEKNPVLSAAVDRFASRERTDLARTRHLRRALLVMPTLTYLRDREEWATARDRTYIWPFC
jgi:hypothetical protein